MNIAVFHYFITKNNPAGKCVREMVAGLADGNNLTVFACEFDNPRPGEIRWVRIPAIRKPLFLLYWTYFFVAPVYFAFQRVRTKFDQIIFTESRVPLAGIAYAHYCHGAYLKTKWKETSARGLRRFLRYLNHRSHAVGERLLYPRARKIVVPSRGLRKEIVAEYQVSEPTVIANPVDSEKMKYPDAFQRDSLRNEHGFDQDDLVMVFIALGDFERKGLDIIFSAMSTLREPKLKLLVVGGTKGIVELYAKRARDQNIVDSVRFVGMQTDVRPFLWMSDAFVFPTLYEIFPLVVLEAAAAGLVLVVTDVYGVEEYVVNGVNGFIVERTPTSVAKSLTTLLELSAADRAAIGARARRDVEKYSADVFVEHWRAVLEEC